jgi:hypothetical protein
LNNGNAPRPVWQGPSEKGDSRMMRVLQAGLGHLLWAGLVALSTASASGKVAVAQAAMRWVLDAVAWLLFAGTGSLAVSRFTKSGFRPLVLLSLVTVILATWDALRDTPLVVLGGGVVILIIWLKWRDEIVTPPPPDHKPGRKTKLASGWIRTIALDFGLVGFPGGQRMTRVSDRLDTGQFGRWIAAMITVMMLALVAGQGLAVGAGFIRTHFSRATAASAGDTGTGTTTTTRPSTTYPSQTASSKPTKTNTPNTTSATTTTTQPVERFPSYAELCYAEFGISGVGAPSPQRDYLHAAFEGSKALKRNGLGAVQAGCGEYAHPLKANPVIYMAVGICVHRDSGFYEKRSVAFADQSNFSIITGQPARFAIQLAEGGFLNAIPIQREVAAGDVIVLPTINGVYILSRPQRGQGVSQREDVGHCDEIPADNFAFSKSPPALLPLWAYVMMARKGTWAWPIVDTTERSPDRRFSFETITREGTTIVATAVCRSDFDCTLHMNHEDVPQIGSGSATADGILAYAPSPTSH